MFTDRKEGGEKLGKALEKYRFHNPLVLGIVRGGVETAYYVAKHLNADFSFVVTRKLGYPINPEVAFGSLAEDGSYFMFEHAEKNISPETIQAVVEREKREIARLKILIKGQPLPNMIGRTVIIVDDGIATGATVFATINLCKNHKAARIIVATPVAGSKMEKILLSKVDEAIILYTPPFYHAVSQGYSSFHNLTDEAVLEILNKWETETKGQLH